MKFCLYNLKTYLIIFRDISLSLIFHKKFSNKVLATSLFLIEVEADNTTVKQVIEGDENVLECEQWSC